MACLKEEVRILIENLHPRLQVVMHLRLEGRSLDEAAHVMECSLKTMKRLWAQICAQCRELVKKEATKARNGWMDGWMDGKPRQ